MNPYIETLMSAQMEKRIIPDFRTGDTLALQLRVRDTTGEGNKKSTRERLQPFIGVVLGRKRKGLNSSVTLHRVVDGETVTLVVPLYSPLVASIEIKRRGDVRAAKIYYLSDLRGKAARIKERYVRPKLGYDAQQSAVANRNLETIEEGSLSEIPAGKATEA